MITEIQQPHLSPSATITPISTPSAVEDSCESELPRNTQDQRQSGQYESLGRQYVCRLALHLHSYLDNLEQVGDKDQTGCGGAASKHQEGKSKFAVGVGGKGG